MRILAILATFACLASQPAHAAVVVSVWSPGVVVFDPYTPAYQPAPRVDYQWVPGWYDEYGYFVPGYWQPVAPNPGYIWAWGYWTGRTYHEGYWRPATQSGRTWIDGYYVNGRYTSPQWVRAEEAEHARARVHARVSTQRPPTQHHEATHTSSKPAKSSKASHDDKRKKK